MEIKQKIYNLLRWSQRYTQTDMVYLAKGGFWLTLGKIITSVLTFILAIAFANLVPKETYGTYKYILSMGGILGIFSLPGIDTALIRAIARGYEGSLLVCVKTKLRWGILTGIASLGGAGYYLLQGNITLTICFLIGAIFFPLMSAFILYESFWTGKKSFKILIKYQVLIQLLVVSILIPVLFLTDNLFLILFTWFSTYTAFYLIAFYLTFKKGAPNKKEDPKVVSYGKHLTLMEILGIIAARLDRILIWHFLGATSVAIYYFATIPPQQIEEFLGKINVLAFPKLVQKDKQEIKSTLPVKMFKLLILIIPIVVVYILLAPYIFKLFFPQYLEAIIYSQLFALTLLFYPRIILKTALTAYAQTKKLYWLRITTPIVQILFLITLTPVYGVYGVIAALLGTQLYATIFSFWLFKRI